MDKRKVVAIEEAKSWDRNRRAMRFVKRFPELDVQPGLLDCESLSLFFWGFWIGTCFGAGACMLIAFDW